MNTQISFTVPCVPVAQPRQRHRVVSSNGRTFAANYLPRNHAVQDFKATVRLAAQQVYEGPPLDGPLELRVTFVMPRPKRLVWKTRPMVREMHCTKPDLDNLVKALKDSLKGLLWRDDCQVSLVLASKVVSGGEESPHVFVRLAEATIRDVEIPSLSMKG